MIWALGEARLPEPNMRFLGWVACDAIAQLLAAMRRRSFVVAVANAKTEVLQVALLSTLVLAEPPRKDRIINGSPKRRDDSSIP